MCFLTLRYPVEKVLVMVLTRIKRLLMKLLGLSMLSLIALSIQGHPGRTNSEGCHAGKLPRHCHDGTRSGHPAQGNQLAPMKETGRSAPRTTASEDDYNRWFLYHGQRGGRKPVMSTRLPAVAVTWKWIVRPARWFTRVAWISVVAWTAYSRRCFSVT